MEPSCTADGLTTVKCLDCGHVISETVIPGGHAYEAVVTEPTCTEAGYTTYTCAVCGESHVSDETAALGHSYEHIHVAPECGKPGYDQHICTVCGYTYADSFVDALECPSAKFVDVDPCQWYHEAIDYVVSGNLMSGMDDSHFGPALTANRAQVVTVLYRLAGSPDVEGEMPFTDVAEGAWFYDAVLWAYSTGIVTGVSEATFAPAQEINRAQVVMILYRLAGSPTVEGDMPFTDVAEDAWFRDAVLWAYNSGIVAGMTETSFGPGLEINRAQFAAMLMQLNSLKK